MKNEIKWILIAAYVVAMVAVVLPAMISAASTELVIGGIIIAIASVYMLYRYIRSILQRKKDPAQ